MAFSTLTQTLTESSDERLCSETTATSPPEPSLSHESSFLDSPNGYLTRESRIEKAWSHWKKLGEPKFIVAPMVDNSELPFRILCRKYGAQAAYTPMLHSRIFYDNKKYRSQEFTTCKVHFKSHHLVYEMYYVPI